MTTTSMSKIEENIRAISRTEARKAWEDTHAEAAERFAKLMHASLPPAHFNRVKLRKSGNDGRSLGAVYYAGSTHGDPRKDIPSGYKETDMVARIEFAPEDLIDWMEHDWIEKETNRIAEAKIKHLLSVAGVS
jgi:hypothetical protein